MKSEPWTDEHGPALGTEQLSVDVVASSFGPPPMVLPGDHAWMA